MTIPLIILAVASTIGWLINAPFGGLDFLDKWLAPVFPATIAPAFTVATGTKWVIGLIATARRVHRPVHRACGLWRRDRRPAGAGAGGPAARLVHRRGRVRHGIGAAGPPGQRRQLPGRRGLVDGTVNGVARLTAQTGRQLRRLQTGYVRNYALGIGIGAAILLAYVATRVGS